MGVSFGAVGTPMPPLLAAAGQGVGAAIGNIIAPHNIVVGAAAVGIIGAEGQVLRRTLPICAGCVVLAGLLLLLARWIIGGWGGCRWRSHALSLTYG